MLLVRASEGDQCHLSGLNGVMLIHPKESRDKKHLYFFFSYLGILEATIF